MTNKYLEKIAKDNELSHNASELANSLSRATTAGTFGGLTYALARGLDSPVKAFPKDKAILAGVAGAGGGLLYHALRKKLKGKEGN